MDVHWTSTQATKESQFRFFLEVSILPTSETVFFWNISFDVFSNDLAPSHMVFGKRGPFLVTKSSTFEGSKKALLFVTMECFRVYHICNGTCPQKKKKIECQLIVAFEKQTLKWQWKEDKIICGKANSYFRRLSGPFAKMKKFPRLYIFSRLGWSSKWNWSKQFPYRLVLSLDKLDMLQRQIRQSKEFAFLLLIGDCKFFFFVWKKCFAFHFLLSLKKHFWLYCCKSVEWKQKQQWDKFRVGKKLERKAKSFNMADWVSVDFDMTLIEHTNWLRMRLKYYELHQKPN